MSRIPRLRRLQSLQLVVTPNLHTSRTPFVVARSLSTSKASQGSSTEWVRGKLWKGEAPGPEDPYTQRMEVEPSSNLPEEALERRSRDRTPRVVSSSRLTLPPRRSEAATEQELASIDPTYVPATTAEGLEEIQPLGNWWQQEGHWGEESEFRGFANPVKTTEKEVLEVYLRRAVVETLTLREAGVFSEWLAKSWPEGTRADLEQVLGVEIKVSDGKASIVGDASLVAEALTAEAGEVEIAERVSGDEAKEMTKAWDPSWMDIALDDELRFIIRKRLYQFTGNMLPDARLGASRTIKHVLTLAAKPPKAKKLAELLEQRGDLKQLHNVKLHGRRLTPIDKETEIGRWKVIEEELTKRGLPVTGTEGLSNHKEHRWVVGKE